MNDRLLDSHNRERALAGVPALRWNSDLAQRAQAWADHLAATGRFEHSPNIPGRPLEGENIWGGTAGAFRPESMVELWIAEKENFIPGVFPRNSRTGRAQDVSHYTQLIWGRSAEVGCGLARSDQEEILVCRYSEPGNVSGRDQFAQDWQRAFSPSAPGQSTLRLPFAMSTASFAGVSSALIEGATSIGGSAGALPSVSVPAVSSATSRGPRGAVATYGEASVTSLSNSAKPSTCGWMSKNCSWLTD
ncbi:MAG: hypothetical protein IBJ13_14055 [Sphingopyxis sp.]|nr:hypothetical protein [Sphingopyxis sp.]